MNKTENKTNYTLVCRAVKYYSFNDETIFFEWIKKIPSIYKIEGHGIELFLYFKSNILKDEELKELIAFFFRFKIMNIQQLQIFLNEQNENWFNRKSAYWYKNIFGPINLKRRLTLAEKMFPDF